MATLSLAPPLLNRASRRSIRKWKFSLHESQITSPSLPNFDASNRVRWLHKARSRRLELILNKPGSLSFNVPTKSIEGEDIFGYELTRCIVAHAEDKNGVYQPIWSGPIYTARASEPSGKIEVTCVGWEELLEHRELRTDVNFSKVTNGEIARVIVNTSNNQYANDGYGLGGVAEDLLYGAGDFESSDTWDLATNQVWTAVGQLGIGDFPITSVGVTPLAIAGRLDTPPSGTHWFRTKMVGSSSPGVIFRKVYIKSRQGVTIDNGLVGTPESPAPRPNQSGFAVEPNQTYQVAGAFRGTLRALGNGIAITSLTTNTVTAGVGMSWYDAGGNAVMGSGGTISGDMSGVVSSTSFMAWANMTTFTKAFTAPAGAAYAAVFIYVLFGNGQTNTVDILWDNFICTKASDPGKRNFPLRGGFNDPYILNEMSDASMETNALSGLPVWTAYPAGVTVRSQTAEWNFSGKNSMKVYMPLTPSAGEYGVKYTWQNGPGTLGNGNPLYVRSNIKALTGGSAGIQMRVSLQNGTGGIGWQAITTDLLLSGEKVLEVYTPSVPVVPGYNRLVIDIFANAVLNDLVSFYIDDITLVEDHPPIPFYEGSQQSARYFDKDAFARGGRSMGPVFTRSYTRGTKLAQILREITEIEWGVDYTVDPITRTLEVWWDLLLPGTSLRGKGQNRPDVIFGYNTAPYNVAVIDENHDGSRIKNRVNTQGKVGWGLAQDFASIDKYGIHEETIPLTDVADPPPPQPSILAVYAGAEVAMFSNPFKLFTFKPKRYTAGGTVPMFGVDYELGDLGRLRSNGDVIKIDVSGSSGQVMRVFGAGISIDDNNDGEIIDSLTTALS